ncbi:(S)-N-methylcoclaurine 3'-hydroxylase [Actinidia chinensis var. chinensis]|uniref:(S)-N-methylcoclaurine 3'-hydroxylase n=1 Tax=Actinidia chinensis var. chinensis TaxID=1590841 RepID=A0A2R6RSW2_ACTCC|nr:(S)-N-methylcoclaurine 3'-hydroxylase [Actinidia chinensis var. chinensis]
MQNICQELAKEINGDITKKSDLSRLLYLEACLKEKLRLHPSGPLLLPHRAVEICEVMGYTIPKDSQIIVNMWAIAQDPKIWDDPLKFKPERFLSSGLDYLGGNFAYIPFGSGRGFCTGQPLASRVVPRIIASLVYHFEWTLRGNMDPTRIDMSDKFDVTMLKEKPLCVIPKLRRPFIN